MHHLIEEYEVSLVEAGRHAYMLDLHEVVDSNLLRDYQDGSLGTVNDFGSDTTDDVVAILCLASCTHDDDGGEVALSIA